MAARLAAACQAAFLMPRIIGYQEQDVYNILAYYRQIGEKFRNAVFTQGR